MNWITLHKLTWPKCVLLAACLSWTACSGGPVRIEDGIRSDVPSEGPVTGEAELRLRTHLEVITSILKDTEDPAAAVNAVGEYLEAHKVPIREDVLSISERMEQMTVPDRVFYEERFSELMAPTLRAWREVKHAFRDANPDQASRIDGVMMYFD